MESMNPYEEFGAELCEKYGPPATILPSPYVSSYMIYSVMKATMDAFGLRGDRMRLPLLNLEENDRSALEKILFKKLRLDKVK